MQTDKRSGGLTKWPAGWITRDIKVKPCNRLDSPEISAHINGQIIFSEGARKMQCGKGSLFNKRCWENWRFMRKNNESGALSYTIHKNQLKMN